MSAFIIWACWCFTYMINTKHMYTGHMLLNIMNTINYELILRCPSLSSETLDGFHTACIRWPCARHAYTPPIWLPAAGCGVCDEAASGWLRRDQWWRLGGHIAQEFHAWAWIVRRQCGTTARCAELQRLRTNNCFDPTSYWSASTGR